MSLNANMSALASRMIQHVGVNVVWQKLLGGNYDVVSGKLLGGVEIEYNIQAHIRNYSEREISGLVEQGDRQLRLANMLEFTPLAGDVVKIELNKYRVIGVDNRMNTLNVIHLRGIQ